MTIPSFKTFIRPTLEVISDKKNLPRSDIVYLVKGKMNISNEEASEQIESGQNRLHNRVGWALTYLKKTKLVEVPERGIVNITKERARNNFNIS